MSFRLVARMPEPREKADVVILGGGLAGLTLALQLNDTNPDLAIVILERRTFPAPEAAYKVGESTVEIGSHYLSHTLGLQERLEKTQLRKFGLRFFFGAGLKDEAAEFEHEVAVADPGAAIDGLGRGGKRGLDHIATDPDHFAIFIHASTACGIDLTRFGQQDLHAQLFERAQGGLVHVGDLIG